MTVQLRLPADFDNYAWEVESKGVFWDATAINEGREIPITFYDPARLAQDIADELLARRPLAIRNLVVLERVTAELMSAAVLTLPAEFFE
jgi:hypothetical protein